MPARAAGTAGRVSGGASRRRAGRDAGMPAARRAGVADALCAEHDARADHLAQLDRKSARLVDRDAARRHRPRARSLHPARPALCRGFRPIPPRPAARPDRADRFASRPLSPACGRRVEALYRHDADRGDARAGGTACRRAGCGRCGDAGAIAGAAQYGRRAGARSRDADATGRWHRGVAGGVPGADAAEPGRCAADPLGNRAALGADRARWAAIG